MGGLLVAIGFDRYVQGPFAERIRKDMRARNIIGIPAYRAFLRAHAADLASLCDELPIEYTRFFRDSDDWEHITTNLVPKLLERKEHVRIWSAGCSTGEEAYSLAMTFAERLGIEEVRRRVTIFASDLSRARIASARAGRFSELKLRSIPETMRDRWFPEQHATRELRSTVRFVRHDLLVDAPFRQIDILMCKNVILYFRDLAQNRALGALSLALAEDGVLCAGPADGLALHRHLFQSAGRRMHQKRPNSRQAAMIAACAKGR